MNMHDDEEISDDTEQLQLKKRIMMDVESRMKQSIG